MPEQGIQDVEISNAESPSKEAGGISELAASLECTGMNRDLNWTGLLANSKDVRAHALAEGFDHVLHGICHLSLHQPLQPYVTLPSERERRQVKARLLH